MVQKMNKVKANILRGEIIQEKLLVTHYFSLHKNAAVITTTIISNIRDILTLHCNSKSSLRCSQKHIMHTLAVLCCHIL